MKKFSISKVTNFKSWKKISGLTDFSYPWQKENPPKTIFRSYYDDCYLYFQFVAFGPEPLIYIDDNNKLEVTLSERVEIFFRSDEKMRPYYCLEIDPCGRVLDYKATYYRNFDRNWEWPDSLNIKTEIDEGFYTVEGQISLSTLRKLEILNVNQMQVGVFRGHCVKLVEKEAQINWISWVDSETSEPDFHVPSSFGHFILQNSKRGNDNI